MTENIKKRLKFTDVREMARWVNTKRKFKFPFQDDVEISIRVVTQEEIMISQEYGRKVWEEELWRKTANWIVMEEYASWKLLELAVYTWDWEENFFTSPKEVGQLTVDEKGILLDYYNEVQAEFSKMNYLETPEDFTELVEDIKKKWIYGMSLNSHILRKLVGILISRTTESWQNDNGFTSSQQSNEDESLKKKSSTKQVKIETEVKVSKENL